MPIYNIFYLVNNQMNPTGMRIEGPVLPVEISVPTPLAAHLERQGLQVPTPAVGRALIDTEGSIGHQSPLLTSSLIVPGGFPLKASLLM